MATKKSSSSASGSLLELVLIVAVALGLALGIQAFLVKPYRIPSESMVPTLEVGQRVLVNRIGNRFSAPSVGDQAGKLSRVEPVFNSFASPVSTSRPCRSFRCTMRRPSHSSGELQLPKPIVGPSTYLAQIRSPSTV